ncbi:MAG: enoyl-CoA hydratase/isomerase family protein [Myxococcales bacterium]|nr:enoyl-CoA hydratase/isomerase family protein [Myxococcales bacterium]
MTQEQKNPAFLQSFDADTGIATLTFAMADGANKINAAFGQGLQMGLDWASQQTGLKGLILDSAHKNFCVGGDIDMMFKQRDPVEVRADVMQLHRLLRRLETMKVPVVCILAGSALGGGYEFALAAHARIAVDDPKIQIGLPEVSLGLLPGMGGTQRLPRLIGLQAALEGILQGKLYRPSQAKDAGMIDDLAPHAEAARAKAEAWIAEHPRAKQPWDREDFAYPGPQPNSGDARNLLMAASAMLFKKTAGAFKGPEAALSSVQEGTQLTFDAGCEIESRYFAGIVTSNQAKDMLRTIWYHRTAAEKHEGLPSTEAADIQKIGILGAGMMGAGLAFVSALRGYDVVLKDIRQDSLDRGMEHCLAQIHKRRDLDETEKKELAAKIKPTLEAADLEGCDLIIEAVFEKLEIKHQVNQELEGLLSEKGIWASNTSALPINDLATVSKHKERFIGLHFFSPVEKMPLLEIILGADTSEETLARSLHYCKAIKKLPIVVNDGYGFYTTRVFSSYILEGAQLVAEGHPPALIEWAARSAGMVVGPLQVFDEVSLSLGRHGIEQGEKYLGTELKMAGVELVKQLVDVHKRNGKAAGAGFFNYADGRRKGFWEGLKELVAETPADSSVELVQERLLLIQCVEALKALEAGVLRNHRDAEIGAIFGVGFAPNTGGPFSYLDRMGLNNAVDKLSRLAERYGERFAPPAILQKMAAAGERFFEIV